MVKFKIRGCCRKCKLLKDGACKDNREPVQRGSSIYECGFKVKYAKDKIKDRRKELKLAEDNLDKACGDFVKVRDGYKCITCDKQMQKGDSNCHWGHFITRGEKRIKWHPYNSYCQCGGCNLRQNHEGNHKMQIEIVKRYGQERIDTLFEIIKESPTLIMEKNWKDIDWMKKQSKKFKEKTKTYG